ncbi:MAG TPA: c-type cytochrome [Verrucomicrobia bacterium]|nr:c-type cytochrome [Verrucomicrobiota bacterium]
MGLSWQHIGSDDPWIRHAARVALENQALVQWQLPALTESNTRKALTALMALARSSDPKEQSQIFGRLNDLPWEGLPVQWQLVALRTYQLAFMRMGDGRPGDRNPIIKKIITASEESPELRMEVSRLLIYLKADGIVPSLLNYVVDAKSPEERLFYLFHMRHIANGWTPAHRRAYFAWLEKMTEARGEQHYQLFLKHIASDALAKVPPGEREVFAAMFESDPKPASPEPERLAKRKVVRQWVMTDFTDLDAGLAKRDMANGRQVLKTAACLACHRFGDDGFFVGPDLTAIGARFDARAMLESILEPSRVIDDKYRNVAISTRQGELIVGRLVAEKDKSLLLAPNPYQPTFTREIQRSAIATRNDSTFSPMPVGLLNSFSREDVLDLLAVLQAGPAK